MAPFWHAESGRATSPSLYARPSVHVVLSERGTVTRTEVVTEEPAGYGFGEACAAVLRDARLTWRPALDSDGQAVEAEFDYRCVFRLR